MRLRDNGRLNFSKRSPAAIEEFSKPEIAQINLSLPKSRTKNQHKVDRMMRC